MFKKPSSGKRSGNLSQFGLLDVDLDEGEDEQMDLSDDDVDLEAELAALSGETRKPRKPAPAVPVAASNLDAMIAASLKDVPSDEEGSGDDDDPDLLNELKELGLDDDSPPPPPPRTSRPAPPPPSADSSVVSVLKDRILNYTAAEKQAKESGESSRARRFNRGLKTLNDLLKQANGGKPIDESEIPPPVALKSAQPTPPVQPTTPPDPTSKDAELQQTSKRKRQFKAASLAYQQAGDKISALEYMQAAESEESDEYTKNESDEELEPTAPELPEPVEPPPPAPEPEKPPAPPPRQESLKDAGLQMILKRQQEFKAAALACKQSGDKVMALEYLKVAKQFDVVVEAYKSGQEMDLNELPTPQSIADAVRFQGPEEHTETPPAPAPAPAVAAAGEDGGLITASSMDEALKQRLAAFQQQESKAKAEGNSSKARRMGRIVKQYEEAIKLHAAGKPIPVDELPTPAGYAPLPSENTTASNTSPKPAPAPEKPTIRPAHSRYDKQLAFLLLRQKEFKEAALKAKKNGNIEQAKEYLRAAKGFDPVIDAARGGLAIDMNSLPLPPKTKEKIEHTFDIVSAEDCTAPEEISSPLSTDEDSDVLTKLSQQLTNQLKLCLTNRDHYREMGNIPEMNRFEHLAVRVKQDLDVVVVAKSLGNPPPKFHYESKQFSVVQCNTDLNENDLELTIVRGITYNVANPKEVDTYVKFEFPFPQDAPVSDRTSLVKDTNSPVYNATFTLAIQRGARPCLRVFKRHGIKLEVYSRGGWFSSDKLLGTVVVKLAPLETHVTIHEAFPLMDGRRPAGGSLEVKLRVRTPLLQQEFENTTHRWLIVDN